MPKEVIYDKFGPQLTNGDPKLFTVNVGWSLGGDVQVATVDDSEPLGTVKSGLYVTLDRDGINRLIKALRKARDQAYGKDE